jgi:hypothetical protein
MMQNDYYDDTEALLGSANVPPDYNSNGGGYGATHNVDGRVVETRDGIHQYFYNFSIFFFIFFLNCF